MCCAIRPSTGEEPLRQRGPHLSAQPANAHRTAAERRAPTATTGLYLTDNESIMYHT